MKSIIAILLLTTGLNASAEMIRLYSTWDTWGELTPSFEINAELGRAWVNIEIDSSPNDPDSSPWDERIKVDGLFYDQTTKEIVYSDEKGDEFVCAKTRTRGRGIFKNTRIVKTNTCTFKITKEVRSIDDGFHFTKRKYQVMNLVINK